MDKLNIYCLHGFLGEASDWDPLASNLSKIGKKTIEIHQINLFTKNASLPPSLNFREWAKKFNDWVSEKNEDGKNLIMGYSLGGRLALYALVNQPSLWSKAFLMSSHPGLLSLQEKKERLSSDSVWADKFLTESWDNLLKEWNSQKVFLGDDPAPDRYEENYNREYLSLAFKSWSLGLQDIEMSELKGFGQKLHWFCGEWDPKYCGIYAQLKAQGLPGEFHMVHEVGHRLLGAKSLPSIVSQLL